MRWLARQRQALVPAAGEIAGAAGVQGHTGALRNLHRQLATRPPAADAAIRLLAATRLAEQLIILGEIELADGLLEEMARWTGADENPGVAGRILSARAIRATFDGNNALNVALSEQGVLLRARRRSAIGAA